MQNICVGSSALRMCPVIFLPTFCNPTQHTNTQRRTQAPLCPSFTYCFSAPSPPCLCSAMLELGTSQALVLLCQLVLASILPVGGNGGRGAGRLGGEKGFCCVWAPSQQRHFAPVVAAVSSLPSPSALPPQSQPPPHPGSAPSQS